jgi:hypothetical protein
MSRSFVDRSAAFRRLPEFELWHVSSIAELTRELVSPAAGPEHVGRVSHQIDLTIADQLAGRGLEQLFTFAQQCDAEPIQNLIPRAGCEQQKSNAGRVAFGPHIDDAILEDAFRAENLVLAGVDNRDAVPTRLFAVDEIVARLDRKHVVALTEPRYVFACPESFVLSSRTSLRSAARPILRMSAHGAEIRFASYSTRARADDATAAAALVALNAAVLATPPKTLVVRSGDMVTFSNTRFLHARGAIEGPRWVKRAYLKRDLSELLRVCSTSTPGVFDLEIAVRTSLATAA